jgi:hypothetical protein
MNHLLQAVLKIELEMYLFFFHNGKKNLQLLLMKGLQDLSAYNVFRTTHILGGNLSH